MRSPGSLIRDSLGDLDRVVVLGVEYVISQEVAIPDGADMETLLFDNVELVAKWERIHAACCQQQRRAADDLKEKLAQYRVAVWENLEMKEREEMRAHLDDETEIEEDRADQKAGDEGWRMRRRQRRAARVTSGPAAGRWRRNFSDDLVSAHVNSHPDIVTCRKAERTAERQTHIAKCILDTVIHRSRCISHLCALHRDNTRR